MLFKKYLKRNQLFVEYAKESVLYLLFLPSSYTEVTVKRFI
jgi:hypothetical protein